MRRAQIDTFWQGPGRRLRSILDSTAVDVRAVLDSSQRATFDAMQMEGGRGGPPPGGPPGGFEFHGPPPEGPPPEGPPPDGPPPNDRPSEPR